MIPYSILGGTIEWSDSKRMDIRVLELAPDAFTFRLPKGESGVESVTRIHLSFYEWEGKRYRDVELSEGAFSLERVELTRFWTEYRVETASALFSEAARRLSAEYLRYVQAKLTLSDEELEAAFAGPRERGAYDEALTSEGIMNSDWNPVICEHTWGIAIETPKAVGEFVRLWEDAREKSNSDVTRRYLEKRFAAFGIPEHPLCTVPVSHIYLGNAYCPRLLPDVETIQKVLPMAASLQADVTIVLPPISQSEYRMVERLVESFIGIGVRHFQGNDLGIMKLLHERRVDATEGVLLRKSCRDPRMERVDGRISRGSDSIANSRISRGSDSTADSRISRARGDNGGGLMRSEREVYLPYYQTNTGTFCPLYAAVRRGGRGNQVRVMSCEGLCEEHAFRYEEHLSIVGRYNSLFGIDRRALQAPESLCRELSGTERVVLNL